MKTEEFKQWLEVRYPDKESKGTIQNRISNCKNIEKYYGDLDVCYEKDKCTLIIKELTYSTKDEQEKRKPKHKIIINGNIRTGTATLKQAVNLYVTFRNDILGDKKFNMSFFDYMGMANKERIHSQFLAWLFSDNCEAISNKIKIVLLKKIFNLDECLKIEETHTEIEGIDIVIITDSKALIVENKLKSTQHSGQLERYQEKSTTLFPVKPQFYYLSFIDEQIHNQDWIKISYSHILSCLTELNIDKNNTHSHIVAEYIASLKQFYIVFEDFYKNIKNYSDIFINGGKKKKEKLNYNYKNEYLEYISKNQLETIFQKSFLYSIENKFKNQKTAITETRGDALIDFIIDDEIEFKRKKYTTFIQLQKHTLKFSFAIKDNYLKSKKKLVEEIIPLMDKLKEENKFKYDKRNSPKSKAYISISKKMDPYYWQMEKSELISFLATEIKNGKELNIRLKELMK